MSKKEATLVSIEEYIECECTITCERCKVYAGSMDDPEGASHEFYDEGWRIVNEELLCPKCFKNRNKK